MKKSLSILIIFTLLFVANLTFAQTSDETILVQLNNLQIKEIKQNPEEGILATLIVTKSSSGFKCSYFPSEESEKSRPCPLKLRRNILKALGQGLKINISEETELLDINRENINLQDLQVGNKINVYGELDKQSYEVDALIVRKIGGLKVVGPRISSLSIYSGTIGTEIVINGFGFASHDTLVWFDNGSQRGLLWGGMPSSDNFITVKLEEQLCQKYTGGSGLPCPSYMNVVPGKYKIYIENLNGKSNAVDFTVTIQSTTSPELLTYITPPDLAKESDLVFKFKYPKGFIVDEGGYKTPGGRRFPSISIKKIGGLDIDTIWIPGGMSTGPEITCKTQLYVGDKCTEIGGYVITTKSKDPSVLKAYEIITSTFEVHYYKNYYNVNTSSITVISPNGGEKWQLGDTHTILWKPYEPTSGINPVTQVTAYLEKLVNGNFVSVGKIVECGRASIHWDGNLDTCGINNYPEPGDYYIRVVNNVTGASDRSDGPFTLVPKGTLKVDLKINGSDGPIIVPKGGATYTVSWTSNAEECNIYGPRDVHPLKVSSSGSISMNLLATDEYPYPDRVSIFCYSKKPIEGSAYDHVELLPDDIYLKVLSPNGGETIDFNSYYKITWKSRFNLTKVSIALYRNDAFYTWIVKDLPTMNALSGSYDWLPSNTVISNNDFGKNIFKIYILGYKSEGGTVEDKSDAPFSIHQFILVPPTPVQKPRDA
jgi:hypothetical protein